MAQARRMIDSIGSARLQGCLLAGLLAVSGIASVSHAEPPPTYRLLPSAAADQIERALQEATHLDFIEQPLSDVVVFLEDLHHIQIELDGWAIKEGAFSADTPVSKTLKDISLADALDLTLRALELDYVIKNDVLLITTADEAKAMFDIRIYGVQTLLSDDITAPKVAEMIKTMCAKGESPVITPVGDVLLVRATQREHREIDALLKTMEPALAGQTPSAPPRMPSPGSSRGQAKALVPPAEASASQFEDPFQP